MDSLARWDVHLTREALRGRAFLLGNKRAFSLSLPAASGLTDTQLHAHKWFGAYLYTRKFLEAQLVRACAQREYLLNYKVQTGFTMSLTSARRDYQIEGRPCTEEFFVPDGIQGFACTLAGDVEFAVEPQFDMRFAMALLHTTDSYTVETWTRGALIAHPLPHGTYDDASETFTPDVSVDASSMLYAAIEVIGEEARIRELPRLHGSRHKAFQKDRRRRRSVTDSAPEDARYDHAPLWSSSESCVYAPVRLALRGHGTVFYGFGASRDEALEQLAALRDNLVAFQVQKNDGMSEIMTRATFSTGTPRVDTAYAQVLARLMDALVARHAVAHDTALQRPATMILAGNQYFHDSWKRDENIALGFLLSLGFYELARDVINDTWQLQDDVTGRLPQRIRAGEEPPYHSSDGTLWALQRLYQYWRCTGDEALLWAKVPMIEHFFRHSLDRSIDGMLPSGRTQGEDYLWETWMDTPHTPRDGFPIEIQMLWISCLRLYRPILQSAYPALEKRMATAENTAWQGLQRFYVRGGMPADSLDALLQVRDLITPNPYFCFGVGLDLGPEVERRMREMGRSQLAGHQGIKTLAPQDWERVFSVEFLSDRRNVRGRHMKSIGKFNYHRGVEWNWLSQFFVQAELKYGEAEVAFRTYLKPQVGAVLDQAGIGGISELFDLSGTRGPEFQAWSMAGFLEALHAFAGVRIDVPDRTIRIEPQLPDLWPYLHVRKWYGSVPFDLRFTNDNGVRALHIEFPWGVAPDAKIEIAFDLPARRAADFLHVCLDGVHGNPTWQCEPVAGTDHSRVRLEVSAHRQMEITLGSKRMSHRLAVGA